MIIHSIYKISNIKTGRFYIGYTSLPVEERFRIHLKDSAKPSNRYLYKAMKKHGKDNFIIETLYTSSDEDFCWNIMEPYFIRKMRAIEKGYNMDQGGAGNKNIKRKHPVDSYDSLGNFICSYSGVNEAARAIGVHSARITMACRNAVNKKASQVKGVWFCYAGDNPVYKIENPWPGLIRARQANLGKKRPEHSKYMKQYHKLKSFTNNISE